MVKYQSVNIKVIRMGLQSSGSHQHKGRNCSRGPYHPAFGQLVKSRIAYNRLLEIGKVHNDVYTAYVPGRELSDYIGQNKCQCYRFKERFGYKDVLIKPIRIDIVLPWFKGRMININEIKSVVDRYGKEVFSRYEVKYMLNTEQKRIDYKSVPGIYERRPEYNYGGKYYTISNIYYDLADNTLIQRSLSKPVYKEKLRLRGYGIPKPGDIVFLGKLRRNIKAL